LFEFFGLRRVSLRYACVHSEVVSVVVVVLAVVKAFDQLRDD